MEEELREILMAEAEEDVQLPDPGHARDPDAPDGDRPEPASSSHDAAHQPRKAPVPTTVVVVDKYGEIRYNKDERNFHAICRNPSHAEESACKRARTVNAPGKKGGANPGQGRPLGLLVLWLCQGVKRSNARNHKEAIDSLGKADMKEGRALARKYFMKFQGAADLAAHERAQAADEDEEPEMVR